MRIAIYSRKSIYTGKGESIENQIEMCKQYIKNRIGTIEDNDITIYEDEGFSGKNIDRPQFQKMLADIKIIPYDYIVCYKLDRVSRNVGDFATLIENLNMLNISFICIKEEFDTSKPMGKAMMYIASVFAQLERETIAERVRDNMMMLAKTGRWLGGAIPTGFISDKSQSVMLDGKLYNSFNLKVDPNEAETIIKIYSLYLKTQSISGVKKILEQQNIKSKFNNSFSSLAIKDILSNPVYCTADKYAFDYFIENNCDVCFDENKISTSFGILSYNKRDYKKKNVPRNDKSKWIISIGKHNGIISGDKWVQVQYLLEKNKKRNENHIHHNSYSLLSGLIICKNCGKKLFPKIRKDKNKFDYICSTKMSLGKSACNIKNIDGITSDKLIEDFILQKISLDKSCISHLEKLKKRYSSIANIKPSRTNNNNSKTTIINKELDALIRLSSIANLDYTIIEHINTHIINLEEELEKELKRKLRKELEENSEEVINPNIAEENIKTSYDEYIGLSEIKTFLSYCTTQEKRNITKIFISKIIWDGQTLNII